MRLIGLFVNDGTVTTSRAVGTIAFGMALPWFVSWKIESSTLTSKAQQPNKRVYATPSRNYGASTQRGVQLMNYPRLDQRGGYRGFSTP
jgi:hypothetical protein